jgi:hypothetical protein
MAASSVWKPIGSSHEADTIVRLLGVLAARRVCLTRRQAG